MKHTISIYRYTDLKAYHFTVQFNDCNANDIFHIKSFDLLFFESSMAKSYIPLPRVSTVYSEVTAESPRNQRPKKKNIINKVLTT